MTCVGKFLQCNYWKSPVRDAQSTQVRNLEYATSVAKVLVRNILNQSKIHTGVKEFNVKLVAKSSD